MDHVRTGFLEQQLTEGMTLAESSDILRLVPVVGSPPERYLAEFRCRGLVRDELGRIAEADLVATVGIWFPDGYLREVDPAIVLAWLRPRAVWHPNINPPFLCAGPIAPGTPLVDLLYRVFELITYSRVTMREDNALRVEACAWARAHQDVLPIDRRPLKRRATDSTDFDVEPIEVAR